VSTDDPDDHHQALAAYRTRWEATILTLPPCMQLWSVESELRLILRRLVRLRQRLRDPTLNANLGRLLLEIEAQIELIEAMAEHSHAEHSSHGSGQSPSRLLLVDRSDKNWHLTTAHLHR
jgi:hypothetical protein